MSSLISTVPPGVTPEKFIVFFALYSITKLDTTRLTTKAPSAMFVVRPETIIGEPTERLWSVAQIT